MEGLERLGRDYDRLCGVSWRDQSKIMIRKNSAELPLFPFAWSLNHLLTHPLDSPELDQDNVSRRAMTWLYDFHQATASWGHHPRFSTVGKLLGRPGSYLHTCYQLTAAQLLYASGNRIGLALEDEGSVPNPDLYMRPSSQEKVHIEVKAPLQLQWLDASPPNLGSIRKSIHSTIKRARSQVRKSHSNLLIIGSSVHTIEQANAIKRSVTQEISVEGRRKQMAALLALIAYPAELDLNGTSIRIRRAYELHAVKNRNYLGPFNVRSNEQTSTEIPK
jgi:hypothetical protein